MNYIFCITGLSSSGKDTAYTYLNQLMPLPLLRTFSDRPARPNESSSTICISDAEFSHKVAHGELLEVRNYVIDENEDGTVMWSYGTEKPSENSSYYAVCSVAQLLRIYDKVEDYQIIPIVIQVGPAFRLVRSITRQFGCYGLTVNTETDEYDKMAVELCARVLRDQKEQQYLDNIYPELQIANNNYEDFYTACSQFRSDMEDMIMSDSSTFRGISFSDINGRLETLSYQQLHPTE